MHIQEGGVFILQSALNLFVVFASYIGLYAQNKCGSFLFSNELLARFIPYSSVAVFVEEMLLVLAFGALLFSCYSASRTQRDGLLNVLLLGAGFCSAFILSFSPTVYSSGTRCYLFMTTAIFLVTARLFAQEERLHFLGNPMSFL